MSSTSVVHTFRVVESVRERAGIVPISMLLVLLPARNQRCIWFKSFIGTGVSLSLSPRPHQSALSYSLTAPKENNDNKTERTSPGSPRIRANSVEYFSLVWLRQAGSHKKYWPGRYCLFVHSFIHD